MFGSITAITGIASKVWSILSFALPFIKGITEIVNEVEDFEPDDDEKRGEQKKELVIEIVDKIYDLVNDATEEDLPVEKETFLNFVDSLVDIVVSIMNKFGVFKKSEEGEDE